MIIEIVDTEEKIQGFLPHLDSMIQGGLVTLEKVQALQCCRHILSVWLWPEFSCAIRPLSIACGASLSQCLPRSISSEPVFLFLFLRFGQDWQLLLRCCFRSY